MFTSIFLNVFLELIAFIGIAIMCAITVIGIIFLLAVIIFVLQTAVQTLKSKNYLEEKTDDTRKHQPKSK